MLKSLTLYYYILKFLYTYYIMGSSRKIYFPILTLIIVILLSTLASSFHFNYFKENFLIRNTATIKEIKDVDNTSNTDSIKSAPSPSPSSSSKNTSQNYFNQISNTDVNSNTLLQPTQSRLDYLNIQNTNTSSSSLNTSINEQQNQSNQINTQKENIYDKAVNFFSPSI